MRSGIQFRYSSGCCRVREEKLLKPVREERPEDLARTTGTTRQDGATVNPQMAPKRSHYEKDNITANVAQTTLLCRPGRRPVSPSIHHPVNP
jgi:hypothetical protein